MGKKKTSVKKFPNGSYVGDLDKNGLIREGKGVFHFDKKDKYDGEWKDDKIHGVGKFMWKCGDRYDGEWKDGKMQGRGVFVWSNGDIYDGEFNNNLKHGKGTLTYGKGSVCAGDMYIGDWCYGNKHGKGIFKYSNGDVYNGDYFIDKRTGEGTYSYSATKKTYEGHWSSDKRNGFGKVTLLGKVLLSGQWKDDVLQASTDSTSSNMFQQSSNNNGTSTQFLFGANALPSSSVDETNPVITAPFVPMFGDVGKFFKEYNALNKLPDAPAASIPPSFAFLHKTDVMATPSSSTHGIKTATKPSVNPVTPMTTTQSPNPVTPMTVTPSVKPVTPMTTAQSSTAETPMTVTPSVNPVTPMTTTQSPNSVTPMTVTPSVNAVAPTTTAQSPNPVTPMNVAPSVNPVAPMNVAPSMNAVTPMNVTPSMNAVTPMNVTPSMNAVTPMDTTQSSTAETPTTVKPSTTAVTPTTSTQLSTPETPMTAKPSVNPVTPTTAKPSVNAVTPTTTAQSSTAVGPMNVKPEQTAKKPSMDSKSSRYNQNIYTNLLLVHTLVASIYLAFLPKVVFDLLTIILISLGIYLHVVNTKEEADNVNLPASVTSPVESPPSNAVITLTASTVTPAVQLTPLNRQDFKPKVVVESNNCHTYIQNICADDKYCELSQEELRLAQSKSNQVPSTNAVATTLSSAINTVDAMSSLPPALPPVVSEGWIKVDPSNPNPVCLKFGSNGTSVSGNISAIWIKC